MTARGVCCPAGQRPDARGEQCVGQGVPVFVAAHLRPGADRCVAQLLPAGQGIGAQHDPPLHLGAESLCPGQRHDFLGTVGPVVPGPDAVAHGVEARQVGRHRPLGAIR